ncbi:hypothetical protein GCM10011369_07360 [Neiella marina]|uniref:TonB-dependent receptor plug domain-containing protein n=1 Tax=Neiella marina TaxID=508461 RepID=A0A8J2XN02_9GAMM|nr:hypothetical protein [Neiella marina]GGA68235.1 hypothetical protein GCM10011369_07360 [Neiella marina]
MTPKLNPIMRAWALCAALSPAVMATSATADDASNDNVERIITTGSHIKGVDMEGATPLLNIDEEYIKSSGANTISELLKDIPQFQQGTFTTQGGTTKVGSQPAGSVVWVRRRRWF